MTRNLKLLAPLMVLHPPIGLIWSLITVMLLLWMTILMFNFLKIGSLLRNLLAVKTTTNEGMLLPMFVLLKIYLLPPLLPPCLQREMGPLQPLLLFLGNLRLGSKVIRKGHLHFLLNQDHLLHYLLL